MNLIRKKQDLHRVAIGLMKDYGLPEHELQAFGFVHRAEDREEFSPDYIAIATKRCLIMVRLKDWSNSVSQPHYLEEKFTLDDLRLVKAKKGFLYYYLAFDIGGKPMNLSIPRRFKWHSYEELAVYLMARVRKKEQLVYFI